MRSPRRASPTLGKGKKIQPGIYAYRSAIPAGESGSYGLERARRADASQSEASA